MSTVARRAWDRWCLLCRDLWTLIVWAGYLAAYYLSGGRWFR